MFKSTFSKYFSLFSVVLVIGVVLMGAAQTIIFYRFWAQETQTALAETASQVASFSASNAVQTPDGYSLHVSVKHYLDGISELADCHLLLSDRSGKVLLAVTKRGETPVADHLPSEMLSQLHGDKESVSFSPATTRRLHGDSHFAVAAPIRRGKETIGFAVAFSSAGALQDYMQKTTQAFAMSALVMLLLVFLVNYIVSDRLVRPLRQMSAAMHRYAAGDFSVRVQVKGKDEVAQLSESLNAMAVSLSAEEETHRSFVANVSHELKTPMTSIAGFVDGILDGTIPPERQEHYLHIVSAEVKRLSRLVTAMLNLSRIDAGKLAVNATSFDLCEVVVSALLSLEQPITARNLTVEGLEDCPRMPVRADRDLLGQVVYNLLENAAKFSNDGGTVRITLRHDAGRVYCTVWNTGLGIPAQELPHIFERFYKTDKSRGLDKNGMGLGLYLAQNIIRLLGGEISVRSVEGQWCAFEFWLPEDENADYFEE